MKTEWMKTGTLSLKGMSTKVALAGIVTGMVLFAAPKPADAQGFSVQFGVGRPYPRAYYGPVYTPPVYGPGSYAERRHEEWLRQERLTRDRGFYGRPPARGYFAR